MHSTGLRERKKAYTRRHIADIAARLFAERGYENVAVTDVARAADVSEKTVYNYFPTKEQLALDQDEQIRDRLVELIRARPADTSPAAAVRDEVLTFVDEIRSIPPGQIRGELGYLAANSPTIRRLTLEMTDRRADAIAAAILDTTPRMAPPLAKPRAVALAWVFQTIIDESGRRIRDGQGPDRIANELHPIIEAILDDLDRWLSDPVEPPGDVR